MTQAAKVCSSCWLRGSELWQAQWAAHLPFWQQLKHSCNNMGRMLCAGGAEAAPAGHHHHVAVQPPPVVHDCVQGDACTAPHLHAGTLLPERGWATWGSALGLTTMWDQRPVLMGSCSGTETPHCFTHQHERPDFAALRLAGPAGMVVPSGRSTRFRWERSAKGGADLLSAVDSYSQHVCPRRRFSRAILGMFVVVLRLGSSQGQVGGRIPLPEYACVWPLERALACAQVCWALQA